MQYGTFDDIRKEYVINSSQTPLPWINYLGNEGFFSLISQTGGGYSFYRDAKLRRITRYRYNNVPTDTGGRMYYIRDGANLWSPAYRPLNTQLDNYRCRHGMGYTVFDAELGGLRSSLTCFVPLGENCEVNFLKLENVTQESKEIELVSAVEWCLWDAVDDTQNFQRNFNTGEVEVSGSLLIHKTEYRERRNHYAFFGVNHPISGFDTCRETFLGQDGSWQNPAAVLEGRSYGSIAYGWAPIASHRLTIRLAAGEKKAYTFILGYCELPAKNKWEVPGIVNKAPAQALMEKFALQKQVESALDELKDYWNSLLSQYTTITGDARLDRMVNIWNQYQNMVTFNLSRSASYYESGVGRGMGFRDSCQDLLGIVHMIPQRARQRILDIAATQLEDGSAWHQYQPLTKQGNADIGGGFNDDPLWLVAAVDAYIRETGDADILAEPVCFNNITGTEAPVFEHLRRSMRLTGARLGEHGLPLIGRADWNDCLNLNCFSKEPGESFQTCVNVDTGVAESVLIAALFVLYGKQYEQLCRRFKAQAPFDAEEEAKWVACALTDMNKAVETHGWDGDWFLRAYDAFGQKVGSADCDEGKIYIEPQGLCIMAGIGTENGMAQKALDSVAKYLETPYGTCLLWPCYSEYRPELGEISSYPPGYKENGGIFCHANPWVCIAQAKMQRAEAAFETYRRISPAYTENIADIHRAEPYVYCQMIAGQEAPTHGEGKNSWLTGTAAWNFVAVSQHLLGIMPEYDGLKIAPCLPKGFDEVRIERVFRGTRYHITLKQAEKSGLWVDGAKVQGDIVPFSKKDTVVIVCHYTCLPPVH